MKTLTKRELALYLKTHLSRAKHGYFPHAVLPRRHVLLPESLPTGKLLRSFREFVAAIGSPGPFLMASDGYSGWRYVHKSVKTRPLLVSDVDEAEHFVAVRSYFRRKFFDNYYVFDQSLEWFALFCHDDDLHFWISDRTWSRAGVQQWLATYTPRRMRTNENVF